MAGQIVDASLVPAPKQRNTEEEKAAIKAGKSHREIRPDAPNRAARKHPTACWTLKVGGTVRFRQDGAVTVAPPTDRQHGTGDVPRVQARRPRRETPNAASAAFSGCLVSVSASAGDSGQSGGVGGRARSLLA